MRLIAKVITIAYTNFHCNKLTTVQDSFKITRVSFFGTQCSSSDNRIHCTKHICKNYVILHISEKTTHAGIVFTQWSKNRFFAPQGRHVAPINVKSAVRSSVANFTFIGAEMWEYSPQNCQNFEFWP